MARFVTCNVCVWAVGENHSLRPISTVCLFVCLIDRGPEYCICQGMTLQMQAFCAVKLLCLVQYDRMLG